MFNSSITGRHFPILKLALFGYVFRSYTWLYFDGKFGQRSPLPSYSYKNPCTHTATRTHTHHQAQCIHVTPSRTFCIDWTSSWRLPPAAPMVPALEDPDMTDCKLLVILDTTEEALPLTDWLLLKELK